MQAQTISRKLAKEGFRKSVKSSSGFPTFSGGFIAKQGRFCVIVESTSGIGAYSELEAVAEDRFERMVAFLVASGYDVKISEQFNTKRAIITEAVND